jgi:hypothetical protein
MQLLLQYQWRVYLVLSLPLRIRVWAVLLLCFGE